MNFGMVVQDELKTPSDGANITIPDAKNTVVVSFPRRVKSGRITVKNVISLPDGSGKQTLIRFSLWLPRSHLRFVAQGGRHSKRSTPYDVLDRLAWRLWNHLSVQTERWLLPGEVKPRYHRPYDRLLSPVPGPIGARIKIRTTDLRALAHALDDAEARREFRVALRTSLPEELLDWSVKLPKWKGLRLWFLKRALPMAFAGAIELVRAAKNDRPLQDRLSRVIEEDPQSNAYCEKYPDSDLALAVALVGRMFRGAWSDHDCKLRSLTLTPQAAFRRYFYDQQSVRYRDLARRKIERELQAEIKAARFEHLWLVMTGRAVSEVLTKVQLDDIQKHFEQRQRKNAEDRLLARHPGAWYPRPSHRPR